MLRLAVRYNSIFALLAGLAVVTWLWQSDNWPLFERDEALKDAYRFRRLYTRPNDLDLEVLTVEPTAEHTHSVLCLHSLGNYGPHAAHLEKWASRHPSIKWYIPQALSLPNPMNRVPFEGWYTPWVGKVENSTDWQQIWHATSHNFYNASLGSIRTFGDAEAYASADASADFDEDEAGIERSMRRIWEIIDKQIVGVGADRVLIDKLMIMGFSQGGVLALALAGSMPALPAGFLIYAGYTPFRTRPQRLRFNPQARIHFVHGTHDDIFRRPVVEYSMTILRDLGYSPTISWDEGVGHDFGPYKEQQAALDRVIAERWGEQT